MKKKWYRGNLIKVFLIAVFHAAMILAAVCGVFMLIMASEGIRIWGDKGNTYIESGSFADTMYNSAYSVMRGLHVKHLTDSKGTGASKVVDLQEVYEGDELSYENTSGLAYSVEDLQKWAQSSWGSTGYDNGKNVITCFTNEEDEAYYYYFEDFRRMVEDGTITFELNEDEMYGQTKQEVISELLSKLNYGQLGLYDSSFLSAKDTVRNVEYVDIHNFRGDALEEKFAPVGADNLLDAVNNSPIWKNRLYEAYNALNEALNLISVQADVIDKMEEYRDGNTNLTYLYVDLDARRVYTNKSDYEDFGKYESAIKEITNSNPYVIVNPKLAECESNLNFDKGTNLQMWQHMADQEGFSENYILAVSIDEEFPVADSLYEANRVYNQYAKYRNFVVQGFCFAVIILLISVIWLTVIAGRRSGDEELYLNWFDKIFTEVAALGVICAWGVCLKISESIISVGYASRYGAVVAMAIAAGVYTGVLFLSGYLSLVRRVKAKSLWKNSLLRWILKLGKKFCKKIGEFLECYSRNTGSKVKMTLLLGGFLIFQFVINMLIFEGDEVFLLVLAVVDCAAVYYFIQKADGREKIMEGLKRISGGELQYKIPVDRLRGEQKTMAEYINHIGEGLDAAVDNSLRNERMKTELITNVSHDIKTPLTSIINYVDLLKRENFTDPKVCGYLDVLEAKAQRLKVLTEDVVEASKASSGTLALEMVDLNFAEMLHQVMGEFEEKFEEKNLTLMVHLAEEPVIIHADGQRLWRVLENVFNNVVKYALEGTRVYVQTTPEKGRVVFSLKNISAQPLNISADELTERFIRGDVSRNTEGSGLGLSIAKSLTELQGGEFRLYLDGDLFKVIITFPLITKKEK